MNSSWRTMTNHSLCAAFTDVIDSVVVHQQDDRNIVSLVLKDGRQVELIGKHVTFTKQPPTMPSVDWTQVPSIYKWLAVDEDGRAYVFSRRPVMGKSQWQGGGEIVHVTNLHSYAAGTGTWTDSLTSRPSGE